MENYLNKALSPKERAADLLSKLTLKEKVNQLACQMIPAPIPEVEEHVSVTDGIGQLAIMGGKEDPRQHAAMIRKLQDTVMNSGRYSLRSIKRPGISECPDVSSFHQPGSVL